MNQPARHCTIVPPYLLQVMAAGDDPRMAASAQRTLLADDQHRARRQGRPATATGAPTAPVTEDLPAAETGVLMRVISDAAGEETLPGAEVRDEGDPDSGDAGTDEAYAGLGRTWALFHDVFGRDSLDGKGLPLLATVHYGKDYDNAFWDGTQMVFGDGDGVVFQRFTLSLDVIGHELAHGVTESTAGLTYAGQSGALNESISDVFGSLVRQYAAGQTAQEADWLIGAELFTDTVQGDALRSMKAPGTAYDDPTLGKDPQPGHLRDFVETTDDNGGVHINSGIPNKAFYLLATALGGHAWEAAGQVWFDTLTGDGIAADCDFATFAALTVTAATERFGASSAEAGAVAQAWRDVGVLAAADDGAGSGDGDAGDGDAPMPPPAPAPDQPAPDQPSPDAPPSSPPTTPTTPPTTPPADTEVRLRRTGGYAGQVRERTVLLGELPDDDVQSWWDLLSQRRLEGMSGGALGGRPVADAFSYEVSVPGMDIAVTLPERSLPEPVRGLILRTLGDG